MCWTICSKESTLVDLVDGPKFRASLHARCVHSWINDHRIYCQSAILLLQAAIVPNYLRSPGKWKNTMCTFHLHGRCNKGASCSFAHSTAELRMPGPFDQGMESLAAAVNAWPAGLDHQNHAHF